ncbi:hypothetical protein PACTADRAFT_48220 [Pachysolen tannophilus NRRL Y-2460]|uniref:Activator of Hsp90 ATPase AHSA1-like N-terminal domain-containing protein n=1 Tax=Pachysolen tannophilus NRRL Y-2460 TaxID=669874 RepID=A0A1E4U391_PACTA|nr:hypothetical protein PACTADRAFT_48220 [Pachysolen tannophilus NRRL Y-2460]
MVVHNPNNWHWVDKNCIDWTREYFKEKLINLSSTVEDKKVYISKIKKIDGDVEVCQRKGKVISLFDLQLILEISGDVSDEKGKINGTITIPELAYDTEYDDFQFSTIIEGKNLSLTLEDDFKKIVRTHLIPQLRKILSHFGEDLIATHGSDIQLPEDQVNSTFTKNSSKAKQTTTSSSFINKSSAASNTEASAAGKSATLENKKITPKYNVAAFKMSSTFNTTAEQLYLTLLDKPRVAAWTRSQPNIEIVENSNFSLFDGNISGKILKLIPNEFISMLWRLKDWKEGHFAQLNLTLKQGESETVMDIDWKGIPVGEEDAVKENFENYYITSIKATFGFGAIL